MNHDAKKISPVVFLFSNKMIMGFSMIMSIAIELFIIFGKTNVCADGITVDSLSRILTKVSYSRLFLLSFIMFCLTFVLFKKEGKFFILLYKYRYFVGALIIIGCLFLEISGSSIGCFDAYLPEDDVASGVIFGHERIVRMDEWQKSTPMAFSQAYNKTGKFPYYSDTLRGCKTDMFIVYGQPVLNPLIIFRPFHLGYLFLGHSKGLSFYWVTRLVVLFLISIEFFMLITDKNKKLSLTGAILVAFAPVVQWWFAINGFVEMLVWGQLAVVCINSYLNSGSICRKWLCAMGLILCSGGYILAFYPAWQVPFAYVFLIIALWIIKKNYKNTSWSIKKDGVIAGAFLISLIVFGLYLYHMSYDSIHAIMNTAYPGKREIFGGGGNLLELFQYPGNLFLPLTNENISTLYNESEAASFFDFFPLGVILLAINWRTTKKVDSLDLALVILTIIFCCYVIVPFPKVIATITLMKYSSASRVFITIGYLNIILLIKNVSNMRIMNKWNGIFGTIVFSTVVCVGSYFACKGYMNYLMVMIACGIMAFGSYFILRKKYNLLLLYAVIFIVGQGILVNPIQRGTDVIYGNPLTRAIAEVAQNNEGTWMTDNISTPLFNLPIMVGAPTVNSINIYPNLTLWNKIDPNKQYEQIYNRQAHIGMSITEADTYFELKGASAFMVYLNINDIKKIGVQYILSSRDLRKMNNDKVEFFCLDRVNSFYIFKVQ